MHEKEIVSSALLYRDQTDLKNFSEGTTPHSSAGLFMAGSDTYLLSQPCQCRCDRTACESNSSRCCSSRHKCSRRHSSRQHLYGPVSAAHYPDSAGHVRKFSGCPWTAKHRKNWRKKPQRNSPQTAVPYLHFSTDQYMHMQPFLQHLEQLRQHIPTAGGMVSTNTFGAFAF